MKTFWILLLGLVVGCGTVDGTMTDDGSAGAGGGAGAGGAGGTGGSAGAAEIDGGGGGGAGSEAGVGGGVDASDATLRPLGAGCAANDQCSSGTCATTANGQMMCCDHPSTSCTACVGGYQTALADGTVCAPPTLDDMHTGLTNSKCSAGTCVTTAGCCIWSEAVIVGDPASPSSYAECTGDSPQFGIACPSIDQCLQVHGQQGCTAP